MPLRNCIKCGYPYNYTEFKTQSGLCKTCDKKINQKELPYEYRNYAI